MHVENKVAIITGGASGMSPHITEQDDKTPCNKKKSRRMLIHLLFSIFL